MEKLDKLIELLNEHEELSPSRIQRKYYQENGHIMYIDKEGEDVDDYRTDYEIISKPYGFIKWLVDNNKVDRRKIDTRLVRYVESHYDEDGYWVENSYEDYSDENTLIMLLAIQDKPVDYLTSILK